MNKTIIVSEYALNVRKYNILATYNLEHAILNNFDLENIDKIIDIILNKYPDADIDRLFDFLITMVNLCYKLIPVANDKHVVNINTITKKDNKWEINYQVKDY